MRLTGWRLNLNGSNRKVSYQFVVKIIIEEEEQWEVTKFFITRKRKEIFEPLALLEQPWRYFISVEARLQLIIVEEEIERPQIWAEGIAVGRARDA